MVSPDTPAPQRVFKQGSCTPLPIVVLHGGPGVPSDYLLPLKTLAAREQRKMFFYDQLVTSGLNSIHVRKGGGIWDMGLDEQTLPEYWEQFCALCPALAHHRTSASPNGHML